MMVYNPDSTFVKDTYVWISESYKWYEYIIIEYVYRSGRWNDWTR